MRLFKVLVIACGILFAQGQLFADSSRNLDEMVKAELQNYEMGLNQEYNTGFDLTYIAMSEEEIETNMWIGFGVNFFLGFGIGSWIQGDMTAGIIGTAADLIGYTAILISPIFLLGASGTPDITSVFTAGGTALTVAIIGSIIVSASRIYQLVAPFLYADAQRAGTASLMRKNKNVAFMFAPQVKTDEITHTAEVDGVMVGAALQF